MSNSVERLKVATALAEKVITRLLVIGHARSFSIDIHFETKDTGSEVSNIELCPVVKVEFES